MGKCRYLNDDVFFDVLSQLSTKILLGLKCVSKGWHALISDRRFIQSQLRKTELSVSGFIFQEKFQWFDEDIKSVNYISIPLEKESFQVKQTVFDFLPEDVVVLASCNGLVCCRSCFPPTQDPPAIYICNPVNKEFVKLGCVGLDKDSSVALAFDPSQEPVDTSTNFKVVRAQQFEIEEEMYFTFEIYSSREGTWRKSNEICKCSQSLSKNKGIYIGGILHWLTDFDSIFTFDLEKELSLLILAPVPAAEFDNIPQVCIGESEGQLHYVMISAEGLHLWCLDDYFECKWRLKYSKPLEAMEKEHPQFLCNLHERMTNIYDTPWMNPLAFEDGLLLMRVSAKMYLYHFETSKMQVVCDASKLGSSSVFFPTVLAYSMSLVPLNN